MKRLFSHIRVGFSKVNWVLRRKINQFKNFFSAGIKKIFAITVKKDYQRAKKIVNNDHIKDVSGFEDYNLDVRFDMDLDALREKVTLAYKDYKKNKNQINKELESLKQTDENRYFRVQKRVVEEKKRLQEIYDLRLALATKLEKAIRDIEHEANIKTRKIAKVKSDYAEEIDEIRNETSQKIDTLRKNYNETSHNIYLNNLPKETDDKLTSQHVGYVRLQKTYKSLPISRKTQETKDKARHISKGLLQALIYLAPVMFFLLVFTFYPIINALRLSVYVNYSEIDGSYEGLTLLGNFQKVLTDANFIFPAKHTGSSAMINTLIIVGVSVPVAIIISLLIAVLLNAIKPLSNVFQTIFFLPYVTNSLAVGLVFAYMFQTNGLFNKFLAVFNINGGAWVGAGAEYWKAMFVLLLFSIWNTLAFKIMVFLSAIQGIDKQYYQAASIDATPRFKQFRRITAPLISPTILYIVITSVIGAFKTYSSVIAIFGKRGQPPGASYNLKTIVFFIYDFISTPGKMAEAAAASIVLFVIILAMTLIQMQVSKRRVHY